ncbi:MAG: hypothetical protein FP816_21060 [Desulfobacteraceae bacterium]|nr:hypothetical protein [Desulfobacteraceae bacterium]
MNKKFIFSFVVFTIALVWMNWDSYPVISKQDLIRQNTDLLAERIEGITPIGSSADIVRNKIKLILKRKYTLVKMNGLGPKMRRGRYRGFETIPEKDDYIIQCTLTTYGWAKNFFCAGSVADGIWLLDENNKLKEITVRRWKDGM